MKSTKLELNYKAEKKNTLRWHWLKDAWTAQWDLHICLTPSHRAFYVIRKLTSSICVEIRKNKKKNQLIWADEHHSYIFATSSTSRLLSMSMFLNLSEKKQKIIFLMRSTKIQLCSLFVSKFKLYPRAMSAVRWYDDSTKIVYRYPLIISYVDEKLTKIVS